MANTQTDSDLVNPSIDLVGMDRDDLKGVTDALGEPAYRSRQLYQWIYQRGVTDFAEMYNLSKRTRAKLEESYRIGRPAVGTAEKSVDGTRKWLIGFADGNLAETVFIPEKPRGTLCVSSQVGCTLTCSFCHTGTQRLVRNLEASEIVGQIMLARDALGAWPAAAVNRPVTNIVMMGMGEPLYNFENVKKALSIVIDDEGLAMSRRRVTLSTSGIVPEIRRCGREIGCMLAISLHAVNDELRDELVPINRKYKIAELMDACREYSTLSNARRITFEYVMLKGVNDSLPEARELVRLMADIPSKVNLIPFNPWPGAIYECSSNNAIDRFASVLRDAGCVATVRSPRGQDIMAACGQLKSSSVRQRRSATIK
ncbi:MAG: 23S rRNA (adenine(2503)-C(2))-methyltransferase RlmN [Rhodospirillaceae bacterium]|nr:23S rRNA (adenine(2503)-C(2))-methyltransferase RlmN [Rhodospirillaceae bacterium]|tara:strand:+ start:342 stop:1451 length:1110 start_codon:yes stop_codon:yes gene_type:complete